MTNKEKDRLIARLLMEVELLNKVVAFLCAASSHRDVLNILFERLDLPRPDLEPEMQKVIEAARDSFFKAVAENRKFMEERLRK